jgi:hypothetical protein
MAGHGGPARQPAPPRSPPRRHQRPHVRSGRPVPDHDRNDQALRDHDPIGRWVAPGLFADPHRYVRADLRQANSPPARRPDRGPRSLSPVPSSVPIPALAGSKGGPLRTRRGNQIASQQGRAPNWSLDRSSVATAPRCDLVPGRTGCVMRRPPTRNRHRSTTASATEGRYHRTQVQSAPDHPAPVVNPATWKPRPGRRPYPCATGQRPVDRLPRLGRLELRLGPAWARYRDTATPETDPPSTFHHPVLVS